VWGCVDQRGHRGARDVGVDLMAEPKKKPKKKPGPKPEPSRVRTALIQVRAMPDWKDWVKALAEFDRCDVVDLIDRALVHYAREIKFPKQAPRR
jgi:hypothetical protein